MIILDSKTTKLSQNQQADFLRFHFLVSSGTSLSPWGGASLALVGHPSSDCVTLKMPYGVDVLHWPASHPHWVR